MALFFPDISGYDAGISIAGLPIVFVKATEGATYTSPDYARVVSEATRLNIPLVAYHFLRHGTSAAAQAAHCHSVAGTVPVMLDVETATDGSVATLADALAFTVELGARGGRPRLVYLPRWYWQKLGSPDLRPLERAGLLLVSSNYTTYTDTGPGWAPYGGVSPTIWQYTDKQPLGGFRVDHNAFRGTLPELLALIDGKESAVAVATYEQQMTILAGRIAQAFLRKDAKFRLPGSNDNWELNADGSPRFDFEGYDVPVLGWIKEIRDAVTAPAAPVTLDYDLLAQKVAALLAPLVAQPAAQVADELAKRLGNG